MDEKIVELRTVGRRMFKWRVKKPKVLAALLNIHGTRKEVNEKLSKISVASALTMAGVYAGDIAEQLRAVDYDHSDDYDGVDSVAKLASALRRQDNKYLWLVDYLVNRELWMRGILMGLPLRKLSVPSPRHKGVDVPLVMSVGGVVYNLQPVAERTLDINKYVDDRFLKAHIRMLKIQEDTYRRVSNQYEERYNRKVSKVWDEALKMAFSPVMKKWRYDEEHNRFVYKGRIVAETIQKDGKIYPLDPSNKEELFYISGLSISAETTITNSDTYYTRASHPNANAHKVCVGDLGGKPLVEVLAKLPTTLKMINMDSAYHERPYYRALRVTKVMSEEEDFPDWENRKLWSDNWDAD